MGTAGVGGNPDWSGCFLDFHAVCLPPRPFEPDIILFEYITNPNLIGVSTTSSMSTSCSPTRPWQPTRSYDPSPVLASRSSRRPCSTSSALRGRLVYWLLSPWPCCPCPYFSSFSERRFAPKVRSVLRRRG